MEKFDNLNCQLWKSLAYFAIKDPKMPLEHWPHDRALTAARWQWWSYLIVHVSDPKNHQEVERALLTFRRKAMSQFFWYMLEKKKDSKATKGPWAQRRPRLGTPNWQPPKIQETNDWRVVMFSLPCHDSCYCQSWVGPRRHQGAGLTEGAPRPKGAAQGHWTNLVEANHQETEKQK